MSPALPFAPAVRLASSRRAGIGPRTLGALTDATPLERRLLLTRAAQGGWTMRGTARRTMPNVPMMDRLAEIALSEAQRQGLLWTPALDALGAGAGEERLHTWHTIVAGAIDRVREWVRTAHPVQARAGVGFLLDETSCEALAEAVLGAIRTVDDPLIETVLERRPGQASIIQGRVDLSDAQRRRLRDWGRAMVATALPRRRLYASAGADLLWTDWDDMERAERRDTVDLFLPLIAAGAADPMHRTSAVALRCRLAHEVLLGPSVTHDGPTWTAILHVLAAAPPTELYRSALTHPEVVPESVDPIVLEFGLPGPVAFWYVTARSVRRRPPVQEALVRTAEDRVRVLLASDCLPQFVGPLFTALDPSIAGDGLLHLPRSRWRHLPRAVLASILTHGSTEARALALQALAVCA